MTDSRLPPGRRVIEDSALIAFLNRLASSSLVWRSLAGTLHVINRVASSPSGALVRWLRGPERQDMSRQAIDVLSQSPAVITAERWFDRTAQYARDAAVYRFVNSGAEWFASLSIRRRLRLVSVTAVVAAATYLAATPSTVAFHGLGSLVLLLSVVGLSTLPFRSSRWFSKWTR